MRRVTALLFAFCLLVFVNKPVFAAAISAQSDRMTRQQISVASNHEIRLTTPTGVQTSSDTITLAFASGFTMSTITASDVDLFHGATTGLENEETVAAAAAAGTWGASVSGQTLTLSPPTDAAVGEIAAGAKLVIRIGTNVSGGTNQITNPGTAGGYLITLAGSFGDSGTIRIPIVTSESTISVSATFSGNTSGSSGSSVTTDPGGGGTAVSPGLPPLPVPEPERPVFTLRNLRVQAITENAAQVLWETTLPAASEADFGPTTSYGRRAASSGLTTAHALSLTDLTSNATYQVRVRSVAADGRAVVSVMSFSTLRDSTPPANPSGFRTTVFGRSIVLSWINPPDSDFDHVVVVMRTDRSPSSPTDGRRVYLGSGTMARDPDLVSDQRYYYAAFAEDRTGNRSSGALAEARLPVRVGEVIEPEPTPASVPLRPTTRTPDPTSRPSPTDGAADPTTVSPTSPDGTSHSTSPTSVPVPTIPTSRPGPAPTPQPTTTDFSGSTVPPLTPRLPAGTRTIEDRPARGTVLSLSPFFEASDRTPLESESGETVGIVGGERLTVRVPTLGLGVTPRDGVVRVGTDTYRLTPEPDSDAWSATFTPPAGAGRTPVVVSLELSGGRRGRAETGLEVSGPGRIFEVVDGVERPMSGARITILEPRGDEWVPWTGSGRSSEVVISEQGTFLARVPNGTYQVRIEREGYRTVTQEIEVTNQLLVPQVRLKPKPVNPLTRINSEATLRDNIRVFALESGAVLDAGVEGVRSPENQQVAENMAAPVAVAVATANMATAANVANLLSYLRFLLTQPILLIARRKRRKWGQVYHTLTKLPVDLAVVRLIHAPTKMLVQTRITDAQGRFSFMVRPGRYKIEVVKPGFTFPTQLLKDVREDLNLLDIYHGEEIEVKEATNISPNIPLDPAAPALEPRGVALRRWLRRLQQAAGAASVIIAGGALFISTTYWTGALFAFQLGMYAITRHFSKARKASSWGIVYEKGTKSVLERVVVRIFDKKFNKLLETQVTAKDGRYGFFVGKNIYYVTAERQGYDKYQSSDLDLTQKEQGLVDQTIEMAKASLISTPPAPLPPTAETSPAPVSAQV